MIKKSTALIMSVIMLLLLAVGCNNNSENGNGNEYPVTVGSVTFKNSPNGVVVLCDSTADIILASSLESKLVARSDECTQEELSVLPSVGSKSSPDVDKIVSTGAELVFADKSISKEIVQQLENKGVTVLTMEPAATTDELEKLYVTICSVLAGETTGGQRGKNAVNNIISTFDDLLSTLQSDSETKFTVCYIIDEDFNAITADSFGNQLIKYTDSRNVAESTETSFIENIKLANPQYIFCANGLKDKIVADKRFASTSAVKDGKVYEMDYTYMTRQGSTMIDAVLYMAKIMYPHLATNDNTSSNTSSTSSDSSSSSSSSGVSSAVSPIPTDVTLKYDDENDYVTALQKRLDELGYMYYEPTGYYGASTQQAVSDFQLYNYDNLTDGVTGIADPETIALLFSSKALKRPEPLR